MAISPQLEKYSKQIANKHQLSFPVLTDKGNLFAARCGLVFTLPEPLQKLYSGFGIDLVRFNGSDQWTLPLPGRFIVDSKKIIRNAEFHPDYTQRPEPTEILRILRSIA